MPPGLQVKQRRPAQIPETAQAGAGLRTFARIAALWRLPSADGMALLGVDSRSTYYDLLKRAREEREVNGLGRDQLDRLSYVLGIYEAIATLFPHSEESRNQWISRSNTAPLFGGRAPIEVMSSSMIGLYQTFTHLVGARGW
ncbi:MAG: antitoxin Xre-like helix-turn-helix domain-containing protein [Gemmatimonadaceae bacterium]